MPLDALFNVNIPANIVAPTRKIQQPQYRVRVIAAIACSILAVYLYSAPLSAADASSRQHAIEIALEQNGGEGKVLGVTTENDQDGSTVFAVKIIANGRVRVFRIKKAK